MMAMRPILPVVNYAVNYNYIVENLCENKEKSEMMCNGKCYLSKELAKTNSEPQNNGLEFIMVSCDSFVPSETFKIENKISSCTITSKKNFYFSHKIYNYLFSSNTFHPPIV
jgi:hypothetical protein